MKTNLFNFFFLLFFFAIFFTLPYFASAARQVDVYNVSQLVNAFSSEQDYDEIIVHGQDSGGPVGGTYVLPSEALQVSASNVTVRGSTGNRDDVKIMGDAMSSGANIKVIFYFYQDDSDNAIIKDMTIGRVGWHAIKFDGDNNAGEGTVIDNLRIIDTYEQMIKGATDHVNGTDNVTVKNTLFEYTAGIGPQYYIGGIDAHLSRDWIIQDNTFKHIQSPDGTVAEHAVHIWDDPSAGSGDNIIERNLIFDCDRGIGLWKNDSGTIRNNMITRIGGDGVPDVGIDIQDSPNVRIYNNSIYFNDGYAGAIEYRFATTTNVLIINNLTNRSVLLRDGATGTVTNNLTNAQASWFESVATGDLHLASAVASVVDDGQVVSGLTDDFDGISRSGTPDIGADEFSSAPSDTTAPAAPSGLSVD